MALTELIFKIRKAEIGSVQLDASVREVHTSTATVTDHPVELAQDGGPSSVTDHIHIRPLQIRIQGIVSNTPLQLSRFGLVDLNTGAIDPAGDSYRIMLADMLARKLVKVVTTLRVYEDMAFEMLEITRDKDKGNALFFTANMKQVRTVSAALGDISDLLKDKAKKKTGKKPAKPASDEEEERMSAAYKLTHQKLRLKGKTFNIFGN
jgi:hypothetical protein